MSVVGIQSSAFPRWEESIRAKWAPVFLEPIAGSSERLIIGVAVISSTDVHLETANVWSRLECLYGSASEAIVFSAKHALDALREDLLTRQTDSLSDIQPVFSNVKVGMLTDAEGRNVQEIGRAWMRAISSLYSESTDLTLTNQLETLAVPGDIVETRERLPNLVYADLIKDKPSLGDFFREDIRKGGKRSPRKRGAKVLIDFSGSKLVANFGTLRANRPTADVDTIKKQLWDLKIQRDSDVETFDIREHEMMVHHLSKDDPQIGAKQYDNVRSSLAMLEEQADREDIRLRPVNSVQQITERIIQLEAA